MSYQALYRVWRPQRFDELVGQQLITTTLKNAIITKQISHAYLFAGPRGTGKTSAAKIFAKAVNCHHQQDGEPCNKCEICQAITAGRLNDVIEIDAASNNSVEEIRDIRDKVKYAPTQADYKVYIIDEVHMLSKGAFNALLKTLEEPPANVIFILATTEPHKIPLTIISRVQRFDFRRISPQDAFERMKYILDQKEVTYEEKALWVIANAAEGGMRDALSILDQVLSFSDNHVKLDDALLVTGSVAKKQLTDYFNEVATGDSGAALKSLADLLAAGKDGHRLIEDLITLIRDLLLYHESPELLKVEQTGLTDEQLAAMVKEVTPAQLYAMIDILNDTEQEMRFTTHPNVYLEVMTVKLSQVQAGQPVAPADTAGQGADEAEVSRLKQEVGQLQQEINQLKTNQPAAQQPSPVAKPKRPTHHHGKKGRQFNVHQIYPILEKASRQNLNKVTDLWPDMMSMLQPIDQGLVGFTKPVAACDDGVVLSFDQAFLLERANDSSLADSIGHCFSKLTGVDFTVTFVPTDKWPQIRQDFLVSHGYIKGQQANQADSQAADQSTGTTSTPPAPTDTKATPDKPEKKTDSVVDKAEQLFGNDVVKVEDN